MYIERGEMKYVVLHSGDRVTFRKVVQILHELLIMSASETAKVRAADESKT
jgi:hypothetical protein